MDTRELMRIKRAFARAEEALGDREKASRWLSASNRALSGRPPSALLDSDAGALEVERLLGSIEHGVYS